MGLILAMTEAENSYKRPKPGRSVHLIALVLGAGVAYAIGTLWLSVTPAWVALIVGATLALVGVGLRENVGDAIIFSLVLGVLVSIFFTSVPTLVAIKAGIVPGACGLCVGNLVGGVWKEIAV